MPKMNLTLIQLPPEKPDMCSDCPLCGLIPKGERKRGSKYSHVCLGTGVAISGRGINVAASRRDKNHPLKRSCDALWAGWMQLPGRRLAISTNAYLFYRLPFEQSGQLVIRYPKG